MSNYECPFAHELEVPRTLCTKSCIASALLATYYRNDEIIAQADAEGNPRDRMEQFQTPLSQLEEQQLELSQEIEQKCLLKKRAQEPESN